MTAVTPVVTRDLPMPWALELLDEAPLDEGRVFTTYLPASTEPTLFVPVREEETRYWSPQELESGISRAIAELSALSAQFVIGSSADLLYYTAAGLVAINVKASDAGAKLDMLRKWTALPMEELADLLGVSRRSTYSWLRGAEPRPRTATKLEAIAEGLRPLSAVFRPEQLRVWLMSGKPAPADLLRNDDLTGFQEASASLRQSLSASVSDVGQAGRFLGTGRDRVFELSAQVEFERINSRPSARPEPLDWDY